MIAEPRVTEPVALADLALILDADLVGPDRPRAPGEVTVTDVDHDSRRAGPGTLFACIRGATVDGHDHAADAVAAGADALLVDHRLDLPVPQLVVADTRPAMAHAAARVHGDPATALTVIGVTGTNGKTTVVSLLAAILDADGRRSDTIGTLTGGHSTVTTPESTELQRRLARMRSEGIDAVAMEISSHALALHRVDGMLVDVAVFTNLSRDHLDFHGTMDAYFAAKARLFTPERTRRAVVNRDDPYGRILADAATVPTVSYGLDDAADLVLDSAGSHFVWQGQRVTLPLIGRVNVQNALAAATAAAEAGIPVASIARGLAAARPVPGRFEPVAIDAPFSVLVDYAHTPDALAHLLEAAREVVHGGRVVLVVGCGGDKDRTKRAPMGEVAARLADQVVLTSDNPRSEDPDAIIGEMLVGTGTPSHVSVQADRRLAIAGALGYASEGDLVVVAGRGHETEQTLADRAVPFDDRVVVAEEWERLGGGGSQ